MIIEGGGDTGGTNKKQPALDATGGAGSDSASTEQHNRLLDAFAPPEKASAPTEAAAPTETTEKKAEKGDNSVEQNLQAADKVTDDLTDTVASKFEGKSAELQKELATGGGFAVEFLKDQNLRTGAGAANAYLNKAWDGGLKKAGVNK
ncbi:MAG: hypothetical protein SGJ27_19255 [Candidatus Melainabacteria bacterium]|nr:hypothetical protein [Candidatus Melainabacteria bacterium]